MKIEPIGIIHTPFKEVAGMPIQPAGAAGVQGDVEVFEAYREALKDLDGFSHIVLLYLFHRSKGFNLQVVPFMDSERRGLFATRAPRRPNPIGLSVVELAGVGAGCLHVRNVDMLDGTPLLDIKPYVPEFDRRTAISRNSVVLPQPDGPNSAWHSPFSTGRLTPSSMTCDPICCPICDSSIMSIAGSAGASPSQDYCLPILRTVLYPHTARPKTRTVPVIIKTDSAATSLVAP